MLAQAAGRSKREIEELAARLAPQSPVPDLIRKLPERTAVVLPEAIRATTTAPSTAVHRPETQRAVVAPLSADTFKFRFTGSRELRDATRTAI
jgi:hypothetical protein